MDQDTIQKIAQEVAKHLPNYSWQLLAVQVMLMIFAFGGGTFCGMHLRTGRKNFAIKGEFDDPQAQLPGNTATVETDKAAIGQEDWRTREWATLRRTKLEKLLIRAHDCEHFSNQLRDTALTDTHLEQRDPLSELDVITTLYFPELKAEVDAYLGQCRAKRIDPFAVPSEIGKFDAPSTTTHQVGSGTTRTDFEAARDRLSAAARKLTTQIMGVDQ